MTLCPVRFVVCNYSPADAVEQTNCRARFVVCNFPLAGLPVHFLSFCNAIFRFLHSFVIDLILCQDAIIPRANFEQPSWLRTSHCALIFTSHDVAFLQMLVGRSSERNT